MEPAAVPMKKLTKRAARPEPKRIGCTKCAAPLDIRNGMGAKQASCSYCGAVIDLTSKNNAILRVIALEKRPPATLQLGDKGKLKGKMWEVIGRLRMEERDEDGVFPWNEYLLFNPMAGYRWLEEDCGHWIFGQKAKRKPLVNPKVMRPGASFRAYDSTFRAGEAVMGHVAFVEGEFPYHTEVGDKSVSLPTYSPPHCLTAEWTDNEIEWTISDYIESKTVAQAFGKNIPDSHKKNHGAQPIPPRKTLPGFTAFCLLPLLFLLIAGGVNYFLCTKYPDVPIGSYGAPLESFVAVNKGIEVPIWLSPEIEVPLCASVIVVGHCSSLHDEKITVNWQIQRSDGSVVEAFEEKLSYYPNVRNCGGRTFSYRLPLQKGKYRLQLSGLSNFREGNMDLSLLASVYNGKPLAQCAALLGLLSVVFVCLGGSFKFLYEFFANLFR